MTPTQNSSTAIELHTVDKMLELFEYKLAQESQKTQYWQLNGLEPGATAKHHWYPILCGVGVFGAVLGIFLVATQNLPLFPGNAAPISGYVLLSLSVLSCMIAYAHREYVQEYNGRLAHAEEYYSEAVFTHLIKYSLSRCLPNGKHLCVTGFNRLRIYCKPHDAELKEWPLSTHKQYFARSSFSNNYGFRYL